MTVRILSDEDFDSIIRLYTMRKFNRCRPGGASTEKNTDQIEGCAPQNRIGPGERKNENCSNFQTVMEMIGACHKSEVEEFVSNNKTNESYRQSAGEQSPRMNGRY